MNIKYTNTFHFKALIKLPKLGLCFENIPSGNPATEFRKILLL
jgi:hypothetical protein